MGLLGRVFEALFTPDDATLPTIQAAATERFDDDATQEALGEAAQELTREKMPLVVRASIVPMQLYGAIKFRGESDTPPQPEGESFLELWFEPPQRGRIERKWHHDGVSEHLVCVAEDFHSRMGARQRIFDLNRQRRLQRARGWAPSENDLVRHFWPPRLREIVTALTFGTPEESLVAERAVARVKAMQRPHGQLWPHWLVWGADEYELAFDLEFGHLLSFQGYRHGTALGGVEITTVAYGRSLDSALFSLPN